jgi:hypothetical protein
MIEELRKIAANMQKQSVLFKILVDAKSIRVRLQMQMKMSMFSSEEAQCASSSIGNQNQVVVCFSSLAATPLH